MRVLVTGGAGFIGSHVVDFLLNAGHTPTGIDDFSTGKHQNLEKSPGIEVFDIDVSNESLVDSCFLEVKPDIVIHLAAQAAISTSIENPARDLEVNGIGTLNVLKAAVEYGVKRFVFASTSAVYKHIDYGGEKFPTRENTVTGPDTPYGISKLAAEGYVRTLFPNSIILRFGNVIGERQTPIGENQVLSRMIRHFKYGDKFYIHGSGNQKRDFVHVSDIVSAVLASMDGLPGTYNIATGEAHSVNEIAKIVEERYDVPGYKWEHTGEEDPRTYICLDVSLAKVGLNWQPKVKLEQAVNQTIDWWESL